MILVKDALEYAEVFRQRISDQLNVDMEIYESERQAFESKRNENWASKLYYYCSCYSNTDIWFDIQVLENRRRMFDRLRNRMEYLVSIGELTTPGFTEYEPSEENFYFWKNLKS